LQLLGRFQLKAPSGTAIPISAKKSQVLIAILALAEGTAVPRSRLIGILWGDRGEDQARSSLRQAFTALRKVFAAAGEIPLQVDDDQAALDPTMVEADTQQFCALCRKDAAGAVALWRGGFLEGLSIPDQAAQDWLQVERQRLQSLYLESLAALMAAQEASGTFGEALASAQQLLKTDPLDEAAQRMVMRCHLKTGERTKALRQYQDFAERLARELGIEPDLETQGLFEEIRSTTTQTTSPPQSPSPVQANRAKAMKKLTIAVLPMESLSADQEQGYFADGLTRELINELGRFSAQEVIAAATMFAFKDRRVNVREVGREVSAGYVLEGNLQTSAGRMRVSAQLIDVGTGRQIWGNRYEGDAGDPFAFQDEVVRKISGNLYHPLMKAAAKSAWGDPAEDPDIQNLYLRSHHHVERPTADGLREARGLC
jgi:TolB-like protein